MTCSLSKLLRLINIDFFLFKKGKIQRNLENIESFDIRLYRFLSFVFGAESYNQSKEGSKN